MRPTSIWGIASRRPSTARCRAAPAPPPASGQADVTVAVPAEQGDIDRSGRARSSTSAATGSMVADERQQAPTNNVGTTGGQLRRNIGELLHRAAVGRADLDRHRVPLATTRRSLYPTIRRGQDAPEGVRLLPVTINFIIQGTPRTRTWARGYRVTVGLSTSGHPAPVKLQLLLPGRGKPTDHLQQLGNCLMPTSPAVATKSTRHLTT
jgi:hypothetical protein